MHQSLIAGKDGRKFRWALLVPLLTTFRTPRISFTRISTIDHLPPSLSLHIHTYIYISFKQIKISVLLNNLITPPFLSLNTHILSLKTLCIFSQSEFTENSNGGICFEYIKGKKIPLPFLTLRSTHLSLILPLNNLPIPYQFHLRFHRITIQSYLSSGSDLKPYH